MVLRYLMVLFLIILISGCYPQGVVKKAQEPRVSYPAMDAGLFEAPSVVFHKGRAIYTWYDPERRLMAASDLAEHVVSEGAPMPSLLSFNLLHSDKDAVYFLFRPKGEMGIAGWKYIVFRASYDGGKSLTAPKLLNQDHGAMEPAIASNGMGSVYVAWYDERIDKFDIFMNISHDYGRTWLPKDIRIDTNNPEGTVQSGNPRILAEGTNVWVTWLDSEKRNMRLMIRHSADGGRTWTEPKVLRERENIYDPKIFMINGRIAVLWCGVERRFQYKIKGIYSDDNGVTWHEIGDTGMISWMQMEVNMATDKAGNIYLMLPVREKQKTGIDNVYFIRSSDKGLTWSAPVRVQSNTPHHTYAALPSIAADDKGRLMVVWVDHRNIRANIYANYSKDFGKTWLKEEILISTPNLNANLAKVVSGADGKFHVVWLEYKDDLMKDGFMRAAEVDIR